MPRGIALFLLLAIAVVAQEGLAPRVRRILDVGVAWHCHEQEGHLLDACVACTAALVYDPRRGPESDSGLVVLMAPRCATPKRLHWNVSFSREVSFSRDSPGSSAFRAASPSSVLPARLHSMSPHVAVLAPERQPNVDPLSSSFELRLDAAGARPPDYALLGHAFVHADASGKDVAWQQRHCPVAEISYDAGVRALVDVPAECAVAAVGAVLVSTRDARVHSLLEWLDPEGMLSAPPGGLRRVARWTGLKLESPHREELSDHFVGHTDTDTGVIVYRSVSPEELPHPASRWDHGHESRRPGSRRGGVTIHP
jgi:hypothetical protein